MTTSEPPALSIQPGPIRSVVSADRAAVLAVIEAVGLFPAEDLLEVEQTLDTFLTGSAGSCERWITDEIDNGSAGVAYYAPERLAAGTWNLYLLAVAPAAQGTGRGAALVRHVEADLRAAGARVLLIETSGVDDFRSQRRFYRSLGYTEEARIRDFYASGDDKVIFWKSLTS